MEKGFNDKELADIMSEIESLEREFAAEAAAEAPAHEAQADVLQELAETPVEKSVPKTNHTEPKVVSMKSQKSASAPACLTFKVEGEMTVSLNFEVNGQTVALEVTSEGLCIETETGAKFSLPMQPATAARKAA